MRRPPSCRSPSLGGQASAHRIRHWARYSCACRGCTGGDGNIRNEFTYAVAPTADAADLLRAHPKLAKALIDCAFPEKGGGDIATLDAALRDALEHAKVVPNDDTERSVHHEMPGSGEVLRLRNIDGVSISCSGSTQHRDDKTITKGVRVRARACRHV